MHASQVGAFHPQYERMRLLIVDDSPAFLEAAQAALANGEMTVVGVASTSDEALERIEELHPDVALVGPLTAKSMLSSKLWQVVPAVKNRKVFAYDTNVVGRPSVTLGMAAVNLANLLHPGVIR